MGDAVGIAGEAAGPVPSRVEILNRLALAMERLLNDAPRCEFEPPSPLSCAASPILNARLELTHRLHVPESLLAAVGKVGRDY